MKLFVVACLVVVSSAARLDNTYLPPLGAASSAGGNFIGTPFRSSGSAFGGGSYRSAPSSFGSGVAAAAGSYSSHSSGPQIGILRYDNDNDGAGSYSYAYETQNHISAQESGQLKNAGSQNEVNSVHGSYSYTGPDGIAITVNYVADENGFQPQGAHLPTPPPIPEAILKSLQYNAANPGTDDDGQYREAPSFNRQYLAPQQPSFNSQSGYRY